MEIVEDVVIVGGGIAGLASAVALKRVGVKALVLERSDGLRHTGAALTLFPNAWRALEALGVSHKLTSIYPITKKGYVTNLATKAVQEISLTYPNVDDGPRTVHRKALMAALAEELPIESIRFSCKITSIETETTEQGSSIALVKMEDNEVIKAKVLIGCDGVHSMVAKWLGLAELVHSGRSAVRGISVYPDSKGHGLKQEVQQFVGSGIRAGVVPLNDKELYWFFTCSTPSTGASLVVDPREIQREIVENQAKDFPEVFLDIVNHSDLSTLTWAPLMLRQPWRVALGRLSWQNVTVCGDAMHPMTPDLGQGGCMALEDAVVLGRHIGAWALQSGGGGGGEAADKALSGYVEERRWRATWIIAGSFLSGWVQNGGNVWGLKFIRNFLFYRFGMKRLLNVVNYDCGKLVVA